MFNKYCTSEYRKDIQGLRAVGAIMIMIFHIWLNKVSGGVDVFFVVSGFLMSYILLKGYFEYGIINPLPFWGGIIKRVAPSAYIVLLVTLIAIYFISLPSSLNVIINEVIASALHIENIQLMRKSVDYLASNEPSSPVQQFWALSIQVQFYLVLPLILIPLAYLSHIKKSSVPLFLGVIAIILISFIYATLSIINNPALSYFNPLSRVWEFFFGILCFLTVSNIKTIRYQGALGFIGLALIIGGAIFIPTGAGFSGPVSLVPVLGAICIIVSGVGKQGLVNRFLSSKALVFLGGMSFTIYLWHWPILVFYKEYFNSDSINLVQGLTIITLSIVLAYVTSRIIESKFVKIPREKVLVNFSIGMVFLLPVLIFSFILKNEVSIIINNLNSKWKTEPVEQYTEKTIYLEQTDLPIERNELIAAKEILPETYSTGCHQNGDGLKVETCIFGDLTSNLKIVLVGGSHATQWLPAIDEIGKDNHFKIISMTKGNCPFGITKEANPSCIQWHKYAMEKIIKINPYAVITNSTKTYSDEMEELPESYIKHWKKLYSYNIKVIGIRDNPRFTFDVPNCIYKNTLSKDSNICSIERNTSLLKVNPALRYEGIIKNIDMSDMFCTKDRCLTQFSNYLMYRDAHHLHLPYIRFIKSNLELKLTHALKIHSD